MYCHVAGEKVNMCPNPEDCPITPCDLHGTKSAEFLHDTCGLSTRESKRHKKSILQAIWDHNIIIQYPDKICISFKKINGVWTLRIKGIDNEKKK
jgi:hypothetical protein